MPRIEELYAWVIADTGPDDEGVPAFLSPTGWMPMMGADMAAAESLRPQVLLAARASGKPIKLVRSVGPLEVVEVVEP